MQRVAGRLRPPKNTTVITLVFGLVLALAYLAGLRWWSLLAAGVAAIVLGEIYHRVTLPFRLRRDPSSGDWAVLYHAEGTGWSILVGGESCSRAQADALRDELEARSYRALVVGTEHLARHGLPQSADARGYFETESRSRS